MSTSWKNALQLTALGVGVTIIGLVVGAFLTSPGVSPEQRTIAFVALGGVTGLVLLIEAVRRVWGAIRSRRGRRSALAHVRHGVKRPASGATAAVTPRPGRSGKTPRTVQALAAAGAAPVEIAWKTGLPLDAVSMLLQINGGVMASR